MEQKNIDILTFREWVENGVSIIFNLQGGATIISNQNKKTFKTITNPVLVEELKTRPNVQLLQIYKENFDWIQEQHRYWLKQFDLLS